MKIKSGVAQRVAPELPREAYRAFFEGLEQPAALADGSLCLRCANPALEQLLLTCGATLESFSEALSRATAPVEQGTGTFEFTFPDGSCASFTLARRGAVVTVMACRAGDPAGGRLVVAERALVEQARTEAALLALGRKVVGASGEEELVAAVAHGVKELFPGRSFCVRIMDARSGALTSLYAEGRLRDRGAREPLVLKKSAVEKTHLSLQNLPAGAVAVQEDVPLLFVESAKGVSAPLVAKGQLFGAINVEWPAGMRIEVAHDERVLVQLANQVAVAVKNAKLIDELTFVRKYLEELLEKANALILVANRDRKVVVFNQALSVLTGFSKEDALGKDLLTFVPESEHLRITHVLGAAMRGESMDGFETRLVTRRGEVRASFATSSVRTPQGEVEGVMAIGQDVTVVKELEKRIVHTEKLASLGQLAASVVHEINNPMTAVATYADALLKRSLLQPGVSEGDQEKLRKILESSDRILRFTRDLVTYARPARDRPEQVSLEAVLDMAVGFCEHLVSQAKVKVERDYGAVPTLSAVRANLVQVFVNLITNACHAMEPGGRVTLSTRCEGREAIVRVKDTGCGIEPRHLPRIFEPFFTTKPEGKGTGLGLSIVQGIVESHGGRMQVESRAGEGTTFVVRLPLSE